MLMTIPVKSNITRHRADAMQLHVLIHASKCWMIQLIIALHNRLYTDQQACMQYNISYRYCN